MNLSKEEFLKMQESALAHAKMMHKEAKRKDSDYDLKSSNFSLDTKINQSKKSRQSAPLPIDCTCEGANHNMFVLSNNNPLNDDIVLLVFLLILIFDKADKILIFALMYIML